MEVKSQFSNFSNYERSNLLSKLFFTFVIPLFRKRGHLNPSDVDRCPYKEETYKIYERLEIKWQSQLKTQEKPKFWLALVRTFVIDLVPALILYGVSELVIKPIQALFLLVVLFGYLSHDNPIRPNADLTTISCYVFCFLFSVAIDNLFHRHAMFSSQRVGMRMQIACNAMIFQKSLKLNRAAICQTTSSQIVNFMSNDINRFDQLSSIVLYLLLAPIQCIIFLCILWTYYGYSCFIAIAMIIGFIAIQLAACKLFLFIRYKGTLLTDTRMRIMSEFISGIKVIKMYCWERPFGAKVAKIRSEEMLKICQSSYLRSLNLLIYLISSRFITFAILVSYVLLNDADVLLTSEQIFVAMFMLNTLRTSLNWAFVTSFTFIAEFSITCNKIQKFLLLEKIQLKSNQSITDFPVQKHQHHSCCCRILDASRLETQLDEPPQSSVIVRNISAKWNSKLSKKTLNDISVQLKPGDLLAVVGKIGSGKSSFLMTLLKELPLTRGQIKLEGQISYAGQEPWLMNETVRANILFGMDYDQRRYQKVIEVCALNSDLESMQFGDQTLVCMNRTTFSDSLKARIELARAVYRNADIFLLDDPLSAMDPSVAEFIFEKCFLNYLKNKIRILVTHQIKFLPKANQILVLDNGNCLALGSYDQLQQSGIIVNLTSTELDKQQTEEDVFESLPEQDQELFTESMTSKYKSRPGFETFSIEEIDGKGESKILDEIDSHIGSIKWHTFRGLFRTGTCLPLSFVIVLFTLVSQSLLHGLDFYITAWANKPQQSWSFADQHYSYILVYLWLVITLILTSIIRTASSLELSLNVLKNLHNFAMEKMMKVPSLFFDTIPMERILKCFAKDLGVLDDTLPYNTMEINIYFGQLVGTYVTLGVINPRLLIPSAIILVLVCCMRRLYINTARDIRRFEEIVRSLVFKHQSLTLNGLINVRAFDAQQWFRNKFEICQNDYTAIWFTNLSAVGAFGILIDGSLLFLLISVTLMVFMIPDISGPDACLAIVSTLALCIQIPRFLQKLTEFECQMNSMEKLAEYQNLDQELRQSSEEPKEWPDRGQIEFDSVYLTYGNNQNTPVLKNINCLIRGGEKIGVVGKNGSGKSSIIQALFRLSEPLGIIKIDGIDIQSISLDHLRKNISVIPQNPVIFSGTIRYNIDPIGQYRDIDIWNALDHAQLKIQIDNFVGRLDAKVGKNGANLSVGQRWLICLARAILRRNSILILDESTSSIDYETDNLIHKTIQSKFSSCTVLTISRRLETVVECDRVMVMDEGFVVEFDVPYVLLERKGRFYEMCQMTGPETYGLLFQKAKSTYEIKQNEIKRITLV